MGTSTDAILALGFDLGEELPEKLRKLGHDEEENDEESFDWEHFISTRTGLKPPDHQDYDKDWPEYWEAKRQAEKDFPLTLIRHCSYEYSMWFLAINGTEQRALRGYPESIDLDKLTGQITVEKVQAFKDFCDEFEIEWQEPKWHIFSMWS